MAWAVQDSPRLDGKLAVVTGANSGIGYETALALARAGAELVLAVRDRGRGQAAIDRLRAQLPDASVRAEPLDLDSLASVRAFARQFRQRHARLDILVNNAGVMALPRREETKDGFERQLGVNFLGHFLLTAELLPLLKESAAARVVQLSSLAHLRGRISFDDLQSERAYSAWGAYCQSKLAMLMFALELDRRSRAAGIRLVSAAAHPGWARSNLIASNMGKTPLGRLSELMWPFIAQGTAAGALPTLYAAVANGIAPGGYYGPVSVGETRGPPGPAKIGSRARDLRSATRLWAEAERLTGASLSL